MNFLRHVFQKNAWLQSLLLPLIVAMLLFGSIGALSGCEEVADEEFQEEEQEPFGEPEEEEEPY